MDVLNHATLPTGLVSYWELGEASGTRVDSHGSNDLSDNNTVGQGTGIQGSCADLERSNSEYLSITDAAQSGLDITGDLSIVGFFKFESLNSSYEEVVGKNIYGGGTRGYQLEVQNNGTTSTYLALYISTTGSNSYRFSLAYTGISLSTWYQIGVSLDVSTHTATFYVNGSSVGTSVISGVSAIANNSSPFHIGAITAQSRYVDGLIDEVGIWSKAITATEVSDLYNSGSGIPYEDTGGGETVFVPKVSMF